MAGYAIKKSRSAQALNDAILRSISPPATGRLELRDSTTRGLIFRITANGTRTWCLRSRTQDGKQTRPKLGTYPELSLSEARKSARAMMAAIESGGDPVAEKTAARSARKARLAARTVGSALAEWRTARENDGDKPWSPRHASENARMVRHDVPALLSTKPLRETTREDWTSLIIKKRRLAPAGAAALWRMLSAFFSFAEAAGWVDISPLPRKGSTLAPNVRSRERVLSDSELQSIWSAADRETPRARAMVRLLILTAAREGEVSGICAGEVALSATRWKLPPERTKNGRGMVLPLCSLAMAELHSVWPNETVAMTWRLLGRSGSAPFSGFSKLKQRIDQASGVTGWRWHDLRRTARTGMAKLGVPRDHAEAALNHISGRSALERTYDRHDYADEVIAALTLWQRHVAEVVAR
jgi:integrase